MNDPIKIIHKYKNNNNRIQYHIHIFIGDILDDKCMRILRKIKDMDLYTSLISLEEREREIIEKNYGEYWYEKFFNSYHVNNTKESTLKNPTKMKELASIYDTKWINDHFVNYINRLETITYNYEYVVKEERERKTIKKLMQKQQAEADDIIDYTTFGLRRAADAALGEGKSSLSFDLDRIHSEDGLGIKGPQNKPFKIVNDEDQQDWCQEESSEEEIESEFDLDSDDSTLSEAEISDGEIEDVFDPNQTGGQNPDDYENAALPEFDFYDSEAELETQDFDSLVEQDLENVDIIFSDIDDTDKNIKLTTREIKEAISNETYEKISKKIADFDDSKDNSMFDENLKDIFTKNYITHQYIFKDDTIKIIHNKICCAFKNDNKFGENVYIIPSYQYLWTEYQYKNEVRKIMLGQKWIVKNDILKIDIEPNTNIGVYEDLRGNLKSLRDNIKRQGKIKREDDENNILFDYEGYFTYNEIHMIDIYNELGTNYDPNFEELRNLIDVYLKIYFPKIRTDDLKNIIDLLNQNTPENKKSPELNKLRTIFETINNDLILENEIMRDIELVRKKNTKEYIKIFHENFVTQSVIRSYLLDRYQKLDIYRIFDNFMLNEEYPFVQYQPSDGAPRYKYNEKYIIENEKKEIIMKWFENSPYGISFKVRINEKPKSTSTPGAKEGFKYMAINLSENGRIDYKIQWKEDDMSTVDDIKNTYIYIRNLIRKINKENNKYGIRLSIPEDNEFRFAFINTIQRFELPDEFIINHNDLSEFSRYFFPYIALVIEPRKRQSKVSKSDKSDKSKFGTYLRYKRVSKYENKTKIEHRIIFFMRNYEYDDQSLANEISKEFNITEEQAYLEIQDVREKYPNLKKSRRILKKLENIPKYKPPGIGVDIQGKSRNKYKMRIAGARNKQQLDRIISFMNILIYLYVETYLYKRPDRQKMKDRLIRLTKIAKRRNKVDEIINHDTSIKTVKQMTAIDKKRLSYKAEEDQNQWTRNCQNSGDDKKRRPQQFLNAEELEKLGYVWSETLNGFQFGHYSRKVSVDTGGKKKKEIKLRAVKLALDNKGDNFVYYTCSPEENGKHMYIGFLSKSKNPYGEAMPCCFIKDHMYSKNKDKRNFYLKSIGIIPDDESEDELNKISGDQLYILQDSNKIQEGRFAFLPKYLDIFLNYMLGNERKIKNHYLLSTPSGYYFKYGTRQDEYKYLNAVCAVLDLSVIQLKERLIKALEADKSQIIFNSLNNGDIRTQFHTIEAYISYVRNNEYLEYPLLNDLIGIPGIIRKNGVNIMIFQKKIKIIRRSLEKEKIKESYFVVCQNSENIDYYKDPKRETIFIIKENKNYYPIIMVKKDQETSKEVSITKIFRYENDPKNIINHVFEYYKINCQSEFHVLINDNSFGNLNAKETSSILTDLAQKEYQPKVQVIDARYKCKYLITYGGFIIPTIPSGSIYNINTTTNFDAYIKDYDTTIKYLTDIHNLSQGRLKLKPIGIYYRAKTSNLREANGPKMKQKLDDEKKYTVSAIMTENYDSVPVIDKVLTLEYIRKNRLIVQNKPNDDVIDKEILKGPDNYLIDNRIYYVSKSKYETELYQLFRFHLSYYLNTVQAGQKYKAKIEAIINNTKIPKRERKMEIKKLLYKMTSSELSRTFAELLRRKEQEQIQTGGKGNPLVEANTPVNIVKQKERSIEVIPRDFNVRDKRPRSNLRDLAETPDDREFDDTPEVPPVAPIHFSKNMPPIMEQIKFPVDEKTWVHIIPDSKKIDYPSFILKNNRNLCYYNENKESCNINQHCNWVNSKDMCMIGIQNNLLVNFINKLAEEFIQNELKAHEILRKGEYFVSDIVDYNIYTERPGEKIIMTSNTNINKILSEIFGKENIPRIGKRRNKLDALQNYEQLNIDNPMKEINEWYIQNIIENNNTIVRAFANGYYWLTHPYNNNIIRNLGYYSILQTELSNFYKSQINDWLSSPDNDKSEIISYIPNKDVEKFIINLSTEVRTLTNCVVELYIMSKINETIIYVYDENYTIIYAFHPSDGIVFDAKRDKTVFDAKIYRKFKKIINLRFHYISKNISPDKIEVLYPLSS